MQDPVPTVRSEDNIETWKMFNSDVTASYAKYHKRADLVGEKRKEFQAKLEALYRPVVVHGYRG
jgi:hypothetical protein